jgi:hypothetical protein
MTTRNSILDEAGDVVLFHACDGSQHLFRDDRADGLLVDGTGAGWTLTREAYTHAADGDSEAWTLVPAADPVCAGGYDPLRREYVARHLPTGRVIACRDTQYGLLARVARYYLRQAA